MTFEPPPDVEAPLAGASPSFPALLALLGALLFVPAVSAEEWSAGDSSSPESSPDASPESSAEQPSAEQSPAEESPPPLVDQSIGVPLRIRDFTFPSFLVLGFAPTPAAPLGAGNWAFEFHYSKVNDFQVSQTVEDYLDRTRGAGNRRPLDMEDVDFILSQPDGEAFFIDGEFDFYDFYLHWGLTDRIDIGASISYIAYAGGTLDGTIFDFHDQFGYGQQGRQYVADDQFQVVFGFGGADPIAVLDNGENTGGFSDPSFFIRYAFAERGGWQFALQAGLKLPLAESEEFLSTGNVDVGLQFTADRRWTQDAVILNLDLVSPGDYDQNGFDPPLLPAVHLTWMRRLSRYPNTRVMLQAFAAEHPFRDLVDSAISEAQVQLTGGVKWNSSWGVFGLGLTENLLNYDNTPDIGLHFTWGFLGRGDG